MAIARSMAELMRFGGSANLTMLFKFARDRPCSHDNEHFRILSQNILAFVVQEWAIIMLGIAMHSNCLCVSLSRST